MTLDELRTEIRRYKYHADPALQIAPRVANFVAKQGKITTLQMRDVIELACELAMEFAFVRHAEQLRVSEHELAEALDRVPARYRVKRAEQLAQLAMHGARHTDRNEPKDPVNCFYCTEEFRVAVGMRAAKARGEPTI
jgi:ubiquinone biosynthesis protein UbiJ